MVLLLAKIDSEYHLSPPLSKSLTLTMPLSCATYDQLRLTPILLCSHCLAVLSSAYSIWRYFQAVYYYDHTQRVVGNPQSLYIMDRHACACDTQNGLNAYGCYLLMMIYDASEQSPLWACTCFHPSNCDVSTQIVPQTLLV